MKTLLKIAAVMMLATGGAASAADATGANGAEGTGAQSASKAKKSPAKATKYCATIEATTGSRIPHRECLTKAEWEQMGVELKEAR
ncbi:MAG TPA: hypothetical protein VGB70_07775 [Allosphingosinicella sp.]|jgi:opacity protein-like surface antigen